MKLNIRSFRYLSPEDWRVLTAFEMGSKNHEVVPTPLAAQLSGIHNGAAGVGRSISTLAKAGLIAKVKNAKYDGYRLTFGGYDYLALHAHAKSSAVVQLGSTMGVGKESDIWLVTSPSPLSGAPIQSILKIHRLGRTSFRTASTKRSYHGKREHASWQFLSRLSAQKEYQAMNAIRDAGFRTPRPVAWNRHTIVMSLIPGVPLRQVPLSAFGKTRQSRDRALAALYADLIELVMRLAEFGLIHGDMNEFNVLIEGVPEQEDDDTEENQVESEQNGQQLNDPSLESHPADSNEPETEAETESSLVPHLIDFPQITSMSHPQAEEFFDRDIRGIRDFFRKRYHFEPSETGPRFADAVERLKAAAARGERKLDIEIEAAGYNKKASRDLDAYYNDLGVRGNGGADTDDPAEEDGTTGVEDDGEVDLLGGAEEEPLAESEQLDASSSLAKTGFHDLLRGLEELRVTEADGQAAASQPKSKKAAGWSI